MFGLVQRALHMVSPILYSVHYNNWCLLPECTLFGKVGAGTKELCHLVEVKQVGINSSLRSLQRTDETNLYADNQKNRIKTHSETLFPFLTGRDSTKIVYSRADRICSWCQTPWSSSLLEVVYLNSPSLSFLVYQMRICIISSSSRDEIMLARLLAHSKPTKEFHKNICFIDYSKAFDCVDHNKLWKLLKEMVIPDHLTCLLRNLCAGQEATFRTRHGTMDLLQIGKGVHQGCILSPCLFNIYAEHIMRNARLDEAQAGIKIAKRNINSFRYVDDITLMVESEEWLKSLLIKVKEESEKAGLKLNIQKTKLIASGLITSWQIDGETRETVTNFIFLGSKIMADGDCSHEIKDTCSLEEKLWQT